MKTISTKVCVLTFFLIAPVCMYAQGGKAALEVLGKDAASTQLERSLTRQTMFTWPLPVRTAYSDIAHETAVQRMFKAKNQPFQTSSQRSVSMIEEHTACVDPALQDLFRSFQLKVSNPAKLILQQNAKEDAFYAPEINHANQFLADIQQAQARNLPLTETSFTQQLAKIPNKRLVNFLQEAVKKGSYTDMEIELREFYSIGMSNAKAAANYAARHPHQPNLFIKRFFKAVDKTPLTSFSVPIKELLEKDALTQIDKMLLEIQVERADQAYHNVMNLFAKDDLILMQAQYYQNFLTRFEGFLKQYGRMPDPYSPSENYLVDEYNFVIHSEETNNFPPLINYIQKTKDLAAPYLNAR